MNLTEFKFAAFDYDDTLFAHEYPRAGKRPESYQEFMYTLLTNPAANYGYDKPLNCMQWLVKELQKNGCKCTVLTQKSANLRNPLCQENAKTYYNIEDYYAVDSGEHKIDFLLAYAAAFNIPTWQILYVEDRLDLVCLACKKGLVGLPVASVASLYDDTFRA